jgi:hypothetical protein
VDIKRDGRKKGKKKKNSAHPCYCYRMRRVRETGGKFSSMIELLFASTREVCRRCKMQMQIQFDGQWAAPAWRHSRVGRIASALRTVPLHHESHSEQAYIAEQRQRPMKNEDRAAMYSISKRGHMDWPIG